MLASVWTTTGTMLRTCWKSWRFGVQFLQWMTISSSTMARCLTCTPWFPSCDDLPLESSEVEGRWCPQDLKAESRRWCSPSFIARSVWWANSRVALLQNLQCWREWSSHTKVRLSVKDLEQGKEFEKTATDYSAQKKRYLESKLDDFQMTVNNMWTLREGLAIFLSVVPIKCTRISDGSMMQISRS